MSVLLPESSIQAVIFDADGVLTEPWGFARHLRDKYGYSQEQLRNFFYGPFQEAMAGNGDIREMLPPFLERWQWPGTLDEFIDAWMREDDQLDEQVLAVVDDVKASGVACCLATNQEQTRARYMRREMGFAQRFNHLFFSCEIGHAKPHPSFFQHVTESLGLVPAAILFFDDAEKNVAAARSYGWHAHQFVDVETLRADVARYLETSRSL